MWHAVIGNKHVSQHVTGSAMFYFHSRSGICQMMPRNQRSTKNGSSHPQKRLIARRFTYAVLCCAVICLYARHTTCSPLSHLVPSQPFSNVSHDAKQPKKHQKRKHPPTEASDRPLVYICSFPSRCDKSLLRRATSYERPLFVCQKCARKSTSEAARPQTQKLDAYPASKSPDRIEVLFSSFVQCCSVL